jgi:Leucine-rich repeat (LRR) protein
MIQKFRSSPNPTSAGEASSIHGENSIFDQWKKSEIKLFSENFNREIDKITAEIQENENIIFELNNKLKIFENTTTRAKLEFYKKEIQLLIFKKRDRILGYLEFEKQKKENIQKTIDEIIIFINSSPSQDTLRLCNLDLFSIPEIVFKFQNIKKILLIKNNLTQIPKELFSLTQLEELHLLSNKISIFPDDICQENKIKILDLEDNKLHEIPSIINKLNHLEELRLKSNKITSLPSEIGDLTRLKKLNLSENYLTHLPIELENLMDLKELSIQNNHLLEMPQLKSPNLINKKFLDDSDDTEYDFTELSNFESINGNIYPSDETPFINSKDDFFFNPFLSDSFIIKLIKIAKFNEYEKTIAYQSLYKVFNFFYSNTQSDSTITKGGFIIGLERLFNLFNKNFFLQDLTDSFKQDIARQILKTSSQIYAKKNDKEFIKKIKNILSKSIDEDSISLLILTILEIKKICNESSQSENSHDPLDKFNDDPLEIILVEVIADKIYLDQKFAISESYNPRFISDLKEKIDKVSAEIFKELDLSGTSNHIKHQLENAILCGKKILFKKILNGNLDKIVDKLSIPTIVDEKTHLQINNWLKDYFQNTALDFSINLTSAKQPDEQANLKSENNTKTPTNTSPAIKSRLTRCLKSCFSFCK